jgi:hypothetical protein
MNVVKAHALGNDFLLVREPDLPTGVDRVDLARRVCDRLRRLRPGSDPARRSDAGYPRFAANLAI